MSYVHVSSVWRYIAGTSLPPCQYHALATILLLAQFFLIAPNTAIASVFFPFCLLPLFSTASHINPWDIRDQLELVCFFFALFRVP